MDTNKKFWDKVARFYKIFMNKNKKHFIELNKVFLPYLNNEMSILEIGCGTGLSSFLMADSVKKIVATDFSTKMISVCNKNNKMDNVIFKVEDATHLSFEDDTFDAVLISNVLHIVPEPDLIVKEIKRVLKKDGIVFAPIFVDENKPNLRLWILKKLGFKVYGKTTSESYINYIKSMGLDIIFSKTINGKPSNECIVIAKL